MGDRGRKPGFHVTDATKAKVRASLAKTFAVRKEKILAAIDQKIAAGVPTHVAVWLAQKYRIRTRATILASLPKRARDVYETAVIEWLVEQRIELYSTLQKLKK
jgi:hypothetical protein